MGGLAFSEVTELTRRAFAADEQDYVKAIYTPEHLVFDFISLRDLDSDGFRAFLRATKRQYAALKEAGKFEGKTTDFARQYYPAFMECWRELIDLLESDPRAEPPSGGQAPPPPK